MTIDDILAENAAQRAEIKWLNDIITQNISELRAQTDSNKIRIDETQENLATSLHPIGTILAWQGASISGSDLPQGWQLCDGSQITRGPMVGLNTPDLNSAGLFLRGGPQEEAGEVQDDAVQDHHHVDLGHSHEVTFSQLRF